MKSEQILKNLSKYELYNKFNQKFGDTIKYDSYCNGVKYLTNVYPGILEICYMFAQNLIKLPEILSDEMDNVKRCRYFNFWITDHVRKLFSAQWKDKGNVNRTLLGFLKVENIIKAELKNNNCYFYYLSNVSLDSWKEWKDLHDYIENYNDIKEKITSDENISDEFINKLECVETTGVKVDSTEDERGRVFKGLTESGRLPSAEFSSLEHHQDANEDGITNNTDYYSKIGGSLSFLGIVSTLFYLYNFTTFGTWVRSKIAKKKIKVNLDEDTKKSMAHELNNIDENYYNDGYNITYLPS
ncbi:PIR Superfamily Protein [Plasmodium ovale wallikeri]|uniref:PIR Superfamily Protein n=1 Tax=Plasmodium ovale wallikeri TaxID=864142 RepID=A0A1A9AQC3_PLAOA|nr:PIR Superfamily Protein [Plasmodium ovale wallikeri]SBT58439.1 PIR Superfamily Protein [Plasmodium ovale wallikeri]